jgi:hypothetical protein
MVSNDGYSVKPSSSEKIKVCGNCARVRFCLNREEQQCLNELITLNNDNVRLMRRWAKVGHVMSAGNHHLDLEKTRAAQLIAKNAVYCRVAKEKVQLADLPCCRWKPLKSWFQEIAYYVH